MVSLGLLAFPGRPFLRGIGLYLPFPQGIGSGCFSLPFIWDYGQ